jgi:pyruvate/2-oxoglutarate dehydrogenase complex dihydrolipoamide dehydrogenase (E3) component
MKKIKNNNNVYQLIIIGSGPAGMSAANFAIKNKLKTLLIEKTSCEGGECTHNGCIPAKTMMHVAKVYSNAKTGGYMGIKSSTLGYNFPSIVKWRDLAVENTGICSMLKDMQKRGLQVVWGDAKFSGPNSIKVNSKDEFNFDHAIIATGGRARVPSNIEGLNEVGYLTYNQATQIKKAPKSVAILGGSAIGCEFMQLLNALGSKVIIIEKSDYLMNFADVQASDLIKRIYTERGVDIHLGAKLNSVARVGTKKELNLTNSTGEALKIKVDEIIVASGKDPNTDLSLKSAKVEFNPQCIEVNRRLETANKNIYAIGDVVGPLKFTHTGIYQAEIAVFNILNSRKKKETDYDSVAYNIFTNPEMASLGLSEQAAISRDIRYVVGFCDIVEIARADTNGEQNGFIKIIADPENGLIIGATIVAPRAGEMIQELGLAMKYGISVGQVAEMVHIFPTWSEAVRIAANRAASKVG